MDKLKNLEYVSGIANRLDLQLRNIEGELSNLKSWIREQYDLTLNENEDLRIDSYGSIDDYGADGSESGSGNGFLIMDGESGGEGEDSLEDDYDNDNDMKNDSTISGVSGGLFDQKPEEIIVQPSTSAFLSAFKYSTQPEADSKSSPNIIRGGHSKAGNTQGKHQFSSTSHQMQIIPLPSGSVSQNKLSALPIHMNMNMSQSKLSQFEKNIQLFTQSQNMRKQQLNIKAEELMAQTPDSNSNITAVHQQVQQTKSPTNYKKDKSKSKSKSQVQPQPLQNPFTCNVCLEKFPDFHLLQQHRVKNHNLSTLKIRSTVQIQPGIKVEPPEDSGELESGEHVVQDNDNMDMDMDNMPHLDTYSYYKCKFCSKVFITKHKLNLHKYRVHRSELEVDLPFKCSHDNCGQTFMSETSLENHQEVSHVGLECKHCQRIFFKRSSFFNHLERVHLCCARAGCEKMFSSKNSLLIHKRKHNARTNKLLRQVTAMGD